MICVCEDSVPYIQANNTMACDLALEIVTLVEKMQKQSIADERAATNFTFEITMGCELLNGETGTARFERELFMKNGVPFIMIESVPVRLSPTTIKLFKITASKFIEDCDHLLEDGNMNIMLKDNTGEYACCFGYAYGYQKSEVEDIITTMLDAYANGDFTA